VLDTVRIGPDRPSALVLWLHGLGADGHDFAPLVPHLRRPDLRFVLPHAPMRPVTINGGYPMRAWYDITRMAPGPGREPEADVRDSAMLLEHLLEAEQEAAEVPWDRVLVVGFSQGGAMALHLALRWPRRLAGVVALSTYLVLPEALGEERSPASDGMPGFFAHGTRDPTVAWDRGRAAFDLLSPTMAAEWWDYRMGHEVCLDEVRDLHAFLARVLPAG
jgi:phospholipase/carboxylesterase